MTAQAEAIKSTSSTQDAPEKDAKAVVEAFFAACSAFNFDAALDMIADDCVYKNVPFHTAKGKARVTRDLSSMAKAMNQFDVEMINIAVNGNVVLTERIDTIGGRVFKMAIPLMGVFVVNNGKISQWRDYFDWSSTFGKMAGSLFTKPFKS